MKMYLSRTILDKLATVLFLGLIVAVPRVVLAQDHLVSPAQLQQAVSSATSARQLHEAQLKSFLAMKPMQKVMKSQGVDPHQVMNAVDQLSNAELARLAAQGQKAQQGFAAGTLGLGIFTLIGIIVVVAIVAAVFA
jgi:hypothetical protein